ncbi:MAG TPA: DUF3299 domain-containing protein [Steroidobacteraceae bacterium]|nr:DUF3299 domain-containing protein [Steroidobacteraceae bacterium]
MGLPPAWVVVLLVATGVPVMATLAAPVPAVGETQTASTLQLPRSPPLTASTLQVPHSPHGAHTGGKNAGRNGRVLELDWRELLPEGERAHFTAVAPPPVHDSRGEGGPPAVQTPDFNVNKTLDGALVRLPGFIVPLEALKGGSVSEFLLVPYFGSCIHVPPPPPNQLVYVHTAKPTPIESIYDAYWVTGRLRLQTRTTRLGSTAYELNAEKIEVYRY